MFNVFLHCVHFFFFCIGPYVQNVFAFVSSVTPCVFQPCSWKLIIVSLTSLTLSVTMQTHTAPEGAAFGFICAECLPQSGLFPGQDVESWCWMLVLDAGGVQELQSHSSQLKNCTELAFFTSHLALQVYFICFSVSVFIVQSHVIKLWWEKLVNFSKCSHTNQSVWSGIT